MLLYTLIIYTFTVNGFTNDTINFPNIETCMQAKTALTATYDKLNETTNLGYSLTCDRTEIK